ncbi:MAG TPA: hypothetical protein VHB25_17345 [Gemmatimonadaceae bacterium]|nr:hypothetical protein [Gemmatimonadaceae bacterium]
MSKRESELAALVREHADRRFEPGFGERVLARLAHERASSMSSALQRQFIRIVPLAAAAALALAGYNLWAGRRAGAGSLDAVLGLPQVTLAAAYSPTALFGAGAGDQESP